MKELYSTISNDIYEMIMISEQCLFDYDEFLGELSADGADNLKKFEDVKKFEKNNSILMDSIRELREIQKRLKALDETLTPLANKERKELDDIDPN